MPEIKALCSKCAKHLTIQNVIMDGTRNNLYCPTCHTRLAFEGLTDDPVQDAIRKKLKSHPRTMQSAHRVMDGIESLVFATGAPIIDLSQEKRHSWLSRLLRNPMRGH